MSLLLDNCGCVISEPYVYHDLTQGLIDAYVAANNPQPDRVYQAWDYVIRALAGNGTHTTWFETEEGITEYNVPAIADSEIIGVLVESGIIVDERNTQVIEFESSDDVLTGIINLHLEGVPAGTKFKILYKK